MPTVGVQKIPPRRGAASQMNKSDRKERIIAVRKELS